MIEIDNLYLIAGLISLGWSPVSRDMDRETKQVVYNFEDNDSIRELVENFKNNRMSVDAQTYGNAIKSVKTTIYQMQREVV